MSDIWRAASRLLDEFGAKAAVVAALRSDQLGQAGDLSGRQVWLQVLAALDELQDAAPAALRH